jgi:phage gp46-like protein
MTDILTRYAMVSELDELQTIPATEFPYAASDAGGIFSVEGLEGEGGDIPVDDQAKLLAELRKIPGGPDPNDPPRFESPDGISPPVEVYPGGTYGLGGFSVIANGAPLDTGPLDLNAVASLTAVADLIQAGLGPTVIVKWIAGFNGRFTIETVATGPRATLSQPMIGAAPTDISSICKLTIGGGAIITQGGNKPRWPAKPITGTYPVGDWVFEAPDLVNDEGLETAVVLSLFTDALANEDDVLPSLTEDDRRGWWAQPWGSKLWLLSREKWTDDVRLRAEFYCLEALEWMKTDGVADRIECEARLMEVGTVVVAIAIYKDGRLLFAKPFGVQWRATIGEVSYAVR